VSGREGAMKGEGRGNDGGGGRGEWRSSEVAGS